MVKITKETMHQSKNEKKIYMTEYILKNVNIIITRLSYMHKERNENRTGAYRKQLNWGKNN